MRNEQAKAAVEQAEQLAEEIMADIKETVVTPAAAHKDENEKKASVCVSNPDAAAAVGHKEKGEGKKEGKSVYVCMHALARASGSTLGLSSPPSLPMQTPAPAAAPATTNKKAPATVSVGQKQTEAARQHFATYEGRAKDVRHETMV